MFGLALGDDDPCCRHGRMLWHLAVIITVFCDGFGFFVSQKATITSSFSNCRTGDR
jgi:hypothetical protein